MKKNTTESIGKIKNFLRAHDSRIIKSITLKISGSERRIGQNGIHYIQLSLQRSKSLLEGYLKNYKEYPLISILAVRCHFESTGSIAYFFYMLQKFYENKIDYKKLDDSLRSLSLGQKVIPGKKNTIPKYNTINVLTMIDKADRILKSISPKISVFRDLYDELSEYCHPNFLGMYFYCDNLKYGTFNYKTKTRKKGNIFRHHLCISANVFLTLYDKIYEVLLTNEELPVIVK